jgi:hypothetical protein
MLYQFVDYDKHKFTSELDGIVANLSPYRIHSRLLSLTDELFLFLPNVRDTIHDESLYYCVIRRYYNK